VGSTVTAVNTNGGTPRPLGSSITLIQAGTLTPNGFNQTRATGKHGATLNYLWDLHTTTTELTATVRNVQADPRAKALSEGFLSGLALVNQGADLVAGQGMAKAVSAAGQAGTSAAHGLGAFGALSGGKSRYNTGSHVDMASLSLIAGLSWAVNLPSGGLTLGAFLEDGNGSYDPYNSFSNAAEMHGKGNIYHLGGGILGRMNFVDPGPGHVYTETSVRAGGVHNGFNSSDLRDSTGRKADYDSDSAYYGFHLGAGYIWNITDKTSLDLYGKYFWTRQKGDSVTLSTGDPVKFGDVDSHRVRGGARFNHAVNEYVSPYIGTAYEHEFDGKARAFTYGYSINAPKQEGGTGIGELGLTLQPSQTLPLSFDLGVQGYVGKREGVTGSLHIRFEF
jgi:outer membrane autotransporter protein